MIKPAASWTKEAGVYRESEVVALGALDTFEGDSINDTLWGQVTAGDGVITLDTVNDLVDMDTAVATDAAFLYHKYPIVRGVAQKIRIRHERNSPLAGRATAFSLIDTASTPVVNEYKSLLVDRSSWDDLEAAYDKSGGNEWWYDGAVWANPYAKMELALSLAVEYYVDFESTDTQFRFIYTRVSPEAMIVTTGWVNWSDVGALVDEYYVCIGDLDTLTAYGGFKLYQFSSYRTDTRKATMGAINIGRQKILRVPITENVESGASITWAYDVGAGWVTGKTLAQLKSDLVGSRPAVLNLEASMLSDGLGRPTFTPAGSLVGSPLNAGPGPALTSGLGDGRAPRRSHEDWRYL